MKDLRDSRFTGQFYFEGYAVEDMRDSWWALSDDGGCCTADEQFIWPTSDQLDDAWVEDEIEDKVDLSRQMNPDIEIVFHEKANDLTKTEDGILFFRHRDSADEIGPWLLLDPAKCVNVHEAEADSSQGTEITEKWKRIYYPDGYEYTVKPRLWLQIFNNTVKHPGCWSFRLWRHGLSPVDPVPLECGLLLREAKQAAMDWYQSERAPQSPFFQLKNGELMPLVSFCPRCPSCSGPVQINWESPIIGKIVRQADATCLDEGCNWEIGTVERWRGQYFWISGHPALYTTPEVA